MILPTSNVIPYYLKFLSEENWILVSSILNELLYIFQNLNSIYNDLDFSQGFEENLFLDIIKLFRHPVTKVNLNTLLLKVNQMARKIIKHVTNSIIDKEQFIKTVQYYISDNLYNDLEDLIYDVKRNPIKLKPNLGGQNQTQEVGYVASEKFINDYAKSNKNK